MRRCDGGSGHGVAAGLWSGYVMQLSQREDGAIDSSNTKTITDELEVHESGPFAPFQDGGVVTFATPCVYFSPGVPRSPTMRASVQAMLDALQNAPQGNASAMEGFQLPPSASEAVGAMEQATMKIRFNLTSQEVRFSLYASEAPAAAAVVTQSLDLSDLSAGDGRRLNFLREITRDSGGYVVPWHRTSKLATADSLTTKHLGSKVFEWRRQAGTLALVPFHTASGSSSSTGLNLNQVVLRLRTVTPQHPNTP